jgi:hypothetical protein
MSCEICQSGTFEISPELNRNQIEINCPEWERNSMSSDGTKTGAGRLGTIIALILMITGSAAVTAQTRSRPKSGEGDSAKQLESRISKAEEGLLQEYLEVANEFYKQGERERAIDVLGRLLKLNPQMDGIKQRVDGLREEMIQENDRKLEFDTSKFWLPVGDVQEGKAFRVQVTGEYRMDLNTAVGLAGLPTGDPATTHVDGVPFGAIVGMVFTDGKPGPPFLVSGAVDHTPKKSGTLFLRVNVPTTAKCRGELKVAISGAIAPDASRNR